MPGLIHGHRHSKICEVEAISEIRCIVKWIGNHGARPQSSEDLSQLLHLVQAVGRNRISSAIQDLGSIQIQFIEPDAEQLHHLTGIVLIRMDVQGIIIPWIIEMAEVEAHSRMETDIHQ